MQTTAATTPATAGALREALGRVGPGALLAGLLLVSAVVVLPHTRTPIYDQKVLLRAGFSEASMPSPAKGLTAELWVAAVRTVFDGPAEQLNAVVKGLAMAAYTIAGTWLASLWLRRRALVAVFVLLLFASQYPFLWISSELFAGAYLCLAFVAWQRGAPAWLTGALLAVFGLAKPDLVLMAAALAGFWAWRSQGRARLELAGGFVLGTALLLAPGLALMGMDYFDTWGGGGRAFVGWGDHFKRVLVHFQVAGPAPVPIEAYTRPFFGDADSMWDVMTHPTGWFVYLEFVVLGALRGVVKVVYLCNWGLAALACLLFAYRRGGLRLAEREQALLVCFVGFVPLVLFTYPHFRYMARFFPVFLLLLLGAAERVAELPAMRLRRPVLGLAGAFVALCFFTLASRALHNVVHVTTIDQYWFPD